MLQAQILNYNALFLTLFLDVLPSPDHVFDVVWEKSALLAIVAIIAVLLGVVCWFLWMQLEKERTAHKASCAEKDAKIEKLYERFADEGQAHIKLTSGLIQQLEDLTTEVKRGHLRNDLRLAVSQLKNGLRALAEKHGVRNSDLNMDTVMLED